MNTSPGYDNIPCWVFMACSCELAGVIAFIITYSIRSGVVPSTWLTAIVMPVLNVRNWLCSALAEIDLNDQFAFRLTGSTNCALIYCFDCVAKMLETNSYMRCLFVDFSKAFDMVNHAIVIRKLNSLNLPSCIKTRSFHSLLHGCSQLL
jgi:Reverse transcriptase (RNA-dependent DNA polymerase)